MRNVREDHLISFPSHLRFSINEEGYFPAELPCRSRELTGAQVKKDLRRLLAPLTSIELDRALKH